MKKRNKKLIGMSLLIAFLSVAILVGIILSTGRKDVRQEEFQPEILTKIDYEWKEGESISAFQVLDENRILIQTQRFENSIEKIMDQQETETSSSGDGAEEEGMVVGTTIMTSLYEWDIEKNSMKELDLGELQPENIIWSGDQIYFVELEEETHGTGENLYNYSLYTAEIGEEGLVNKTQITLQEQEIFYLDVLATYKDQILFSGVSPEGGVLYYMGTLKENVICDIEPMDILEDSELLGRAFFVNDGTKLLAIVLEMEEPEDILMSSIVWKTKYELWDVFQEKERDSRERTKLSLDYGQEDMIESPYFSIDMELDNIYYLGEENTVYRGSLTAFLMNAIEQAKGNSDHAEGNEEEGATEPYQSGTYSCDTYDVGSFTSELRNKAAEEDKQGVYYEIFVRSFADSDGDGIGDINGITKRLDYLKELGLDGIWLMPINESGSYHGYDITDYLSLNSDYGTEADFVNLLKEAHARGMKVIMDFPINHTSSDHPWFQAALSDENSEYRDYYRWVASNDTLDFSKEDESNWGSGVWHKAGDFYYYGMFGADMPDLNFNNPAVREEIKAAAGKWLELGVDGFRLDAAMHIYGVNEFKQEENPTESTISWWNEFALYCEGINPKVYLVGEAWQDKKVLEEYVQPFDTKFNFSVQQALLDSMTNGTAIDENGTNLSALVESILNTYDTVDTNYLDGVFGSNHDQERIMSTVQDTKKAKQVAFVYMTLPGNPYIYYGEEIGMFGEKPDERIRAPFLWGEDFSENTSWIQDDQNAETQTLEEQMEDEDSMYSFYKNLIRVRKNSLALMQGDYSSVDLKNDSIMAYIRESEEQKLLIIHNFSERGQTIDLQDYPVKEILYSTQEEVEEPLVIGGNESVILELEQ